MTLINSFNDNTVNTTNSRFNIKLNDNNKSESASVTTINKDEFKFRSNSTHQVDLDTLPGKFSQIEKEYSQSTGIKIKDSSKDVKGVTGYDFVKNHLQPYDLTTSNYNTGKEEELMQKVQDLAKEKKLNGEKIQPEDLYRLSLELNDGDRFKALVTVHDALKMTGRGEQMGSEFTTEKSMKNKVGEEFFNNYVAKHGGNYNPDMANEMGEAFLAENFARMGSPDDYTGKYYHMFGTAAGALVGGLARTATYLHAFGCNSKTNMDNKQNEVREFYGDNVVGDTLGWLARPAVLIASGFGTFYGQYTTENTDKWNADKTGVKIGDQLGSN